MRILTWSSIDEQHFTQIPDQFYGQKNGHLKKKADQGQDSATKQCNEMYI